jgi:hypothetical protein
VTEEWRPVVGYEGRYEVSSHGRVRSLGFDSANRWGTKNAARRNRVLSTFAVKGHGYRAVTLVTDGHGVQCPEAKRSPTSSCGRSWANRRPGEPNGLHKDDDPANNRSR